VRGAPKTTYQLLIKNSGDATKLSCEWLALRKADMFDSAGLADIGIPVGFTGYVDIPREADINGAGVGLRLFPNHCLSVRYLNLADHGDQVAVYRAPYWPAKRNTTFIHKHAGDPPAPLADCSPRQVINGVSRPVSAEKYAWISDPAQAFPQDITLTFPHPVNIGLLQLTFDTDLNNPCFSFESQPVVPGLVKDYDILADGVIAAEVRDSNARLRRHKLNADGINNITVRVLSSYGDKSARIFEIRAYE
jgi:hypothetical protein